MKKTTLLGIVLAIVLPTHYCSAQTKDEKVETGTITGKLDSVWAKRKTAVVYLKNVEGNFEPPKVNPVMDQQKLTFVPSVLPILKGTTVDFPNNDTVRHNVFSPTRSAKKFNLGLYPAGLSKSLTFEKEGVVPLLCNVHSEMAAFVVVLPNPYFTVTDKKGNFTIENVPPGTYKLTFWHEKLKPQTVEFPVKAGKTTKLTFKKLKRGKYSTDLK